MQEEDFDHTVNKLRHPDRIAQLKVPQVVALCLENCRLENLLDIGTGSGLFAEAFAAAGTRVVGIDPDPEMIASARLHAPGVFFGVGAAEALPFAEDSFDALFMGMVLHETADPYLSLKEARRVAKKYLAILEWTPPEPGDPPPPARRFTHRQIDAMCRAAGFAVELGQAILYLLR